jgi:hypothetical protein
MSKTTGAERIVDSPIRAAEVAAELGVELDELRRLAGKEIREDALGRGWLDAPAVRKLRDELERERIQSIEDAGGFVDYLNARSAARQMLYQEAYGSGLQKSHKRDVEHAHKIDSGEIPSDYASYKTGQVINPQSRVRGTEAARMATRKFDRKHPEPGGVGEWIEMGRPRWKEGIAR